jgi:hypothetical protein
VSASVRVPKKNSHAPMIGWNRNPEGVFSQLVHVDPNFVRPLFSDVLCAAFNEYNSLRLENAKQARTRMLNSVPQPSAAIALHKVPIVYRLKSRPERTCTRDCLFCCRDNFPVALESPPPHPPTFEHRTEPVRDPRAMRQKPRLPCLVRPLPVCTPPCCATSPQPANIRVTYAL